MASRTSNLAIRLATAAVCVPIILGLLYRAPPWAFYLLVLTVALIGVRELLSMTHPGDAAAQAVGVVVSAAASVAVFLHGEDARTLVTVLVAVPMVGFGPLFVAVPLTLLALMRRTLGAGVGPGVVLLCLGLAWFADTSAYFAGRFLGRRKLYEAVSPKKTLEGAIGGLLGSVVWALLASLCFLRGALPVAHAVPLAVVGGVLGQAGDLAESLLKRSTGIKDSGDIVPGHGGILDRVDALLMTSVVVFLYTLWIGLS
jgi:phosphatidate cytidylyltransferase